MRSRRLRRVAILAILSFFLVVGGAQPARALVMPTDVRGMYHGFFQSLETRGLWGNLEFSINEMHNRRWTGMVTMIFPTGASPIELPFVVEGTIAASGEFTGVGKSPAGMVQFHGQISLLQDGAAIADATYHFYPPGPSTPGEVQPGPPDRGTATLLRDFVDVSDVPNVSGDWNGCYASFGDGGNGSFHLDVRQGSDTAGDTAPTPGSFFGQEVIDGNVLNPFYFRGSINGDGMFAVIGWDQMADHFIVTGDYTPPPDPDHPASAEGLYALMFANGMTDRGRLFDWTQQSIPPPCRAVGDVSGQGQ